MNWMSLFINLAPAIVKMIGIAEKAFSDKPKSGAEKKELVMQSTKAIVDGMQAVSTGGQKETWDQLEEPLSGLVDAAAAAIFKPEPQQE